MTLQFSFSSALLCDCGKTKVNSLKKKKKKGTLRGWRALPYSVFVIAAKL